MYLLPLVSIVRRSVGSRRKEFWYHMICKETKMIWVSIVVCWIFDVSVEHSGSQPGLPYLLPIATLKHNNCLFKLRVLKLLLLFPLLLDFHINYQTFAHPTALRTVAKGAHETQKHFCRHVSCRNFVQRLLLFALWTFCCSSSDFLWSQNNCEMFLPESSLREKWTSDIDSLSVCRMLS